jgi:hypothetical protein
MVLVFALFSASRVDAQSTAPRQAAVETSDTHVASEIHAKLTASPMLRGLNLGVWVHGGVATLTGVVPSEAARQEAQNLAHSVAGIQTVDDQLTISPLAAEQAPPQTGYPPPPGTDASEQSPGVHGEPGYSDESPGGAAGAPGAEHPPGPPPPPPSEPSASQHPGSANQAPGPLPMLTVPAGTPITAMMLNNVDTRHTKAGFRFRAVVVRDVILLNGATAIPRGSYVDGEIIDARPAGKLKGRPQLALQLNGVQIGNEQYPMESQVWARQGEGKGGQTAVTTGGTAAMGAMIGGIAGGGGGAGIGAILGGLGGLGLSSLSHGDRLVVPAESVITFYLSGPVTLREPGPNVARSLAGNIPAPHYGPTPYGPPPGPNRGPYPYPPTPIPGAPPGGYPY